jgi:hypothetical protein
MRNLRLRSVAPARNVETAPTPTVNVLRGLVIPYRFPTGRFVTVCATEEGLFGGR